MPMLEIREAACNKETRHARKQAQRAKKETRIKYIHVAVDDKKKSIKLL